MLLDMVIVNCL